MLTWLIAAITSFTQNIQQARRSSLLPLIAPFLLLVAIGTLVYARLESWTLLDALYATVITMTTVGYGDLSPQTPAGRIFAIFFTLFAIGLAGYALMSGAPSPSLSLPFAAMVNSSTRPIPPKLCCATIY